MINLLPLSDDQQRVVINSQMKGNVFFDHLMSLSVIRKGQDDIYASGVPAGERGRQRIEAIKAPDRFYLPGTSLFDPAMRQYDLSGARCVHALSEGRRPPPQIRRLRPPRRRSSARSTSRGTAAAAPAAASGGDGAPRARRRARRPAARKRSARRRARTGRWRLRGHARGR